MNNNKTNKYDDVHDWLSSVQRLDRQINMKLAEKKQIFDMITSYTPNNDGMPHGCDVSDPVGNGVAKLVDLSREIDALIDSYVDTRDEVIKALDILPPNEYEVIHGHFILGMTYEAIAVDMGMSYRHVMRLKNKSLKKLKCHRMSHSKVV